MAKVRSIKPEPGISKVLTGARFVDAYRATVAAAGMDATSVARLMLGRPPKWVDRLLRLRNALVTPLGLKTGRQIDDSRKAIGILPIVSATPSRVVLGLEDKHLDFRLVIDVVGAGGVSEVTATTLVRPHNLLGLLYLTTILPFHKLIVWSLLKRMVTT
jgi:Protein of unknown function (DUF2867)